MNLSEKVVFVTGAANGIGKAIAKLTYEKGATVIMADIAVQKLEELTSGWDTTRFLTVMINVSSAADWQRAIELTISKFKKIDILCNVAGIVEPGYIHETTLDKIDRQIDINLKGTIYGTHTVSKQMVKQGGGHIINMASLAALAPVAGINIYTATKYGVRSFSLAIADELEEHHIHVSVICPDSVKTPMLDYEKDKIESALAFSGSRLLTPEEVADAILKQAIEKKKQEVWIPYHRGVLAFASSLFPRVSHLLKDIFIKKGLENQKKYRELNV